MAARRPILVLDACISRPCYGTPQENGIGSSCNSCSFLEQLMTEWANESFPLLMLATISVPHL